MGACYDSFSCRATSHTDAIDKCHAHIEECTWEYGNSGYSGSMADCAGVCMTNEVFGSGSDAENWLDENAEKRGPALGVIVRDPRQESEYYMFGAICPE